MQRDAPTRGVGPWLKRWGPRIFGIALFAFVLWKVGVGQVWAALREADPWPLLPAFLATIPFIAVKGWRWAGLAMGLGTPRLGSGLALRLYAIGIWWGQATPGRRATSSRRGICAARGPRWPRR